VKKGAEAKMETNTPTLTSLEWLIIREALKHKKKAVQSGMYDDYDGEINEPKSETSEWAIHLDEILQNISKTGEADIENLQRRDWEEIYNCLDDAALQEKIGPDGDNMYEN
jgi:hypothetical protein